MTVHLKRLTMLARETTLAGQHEELGERCAQLIVNAERWLHFGIQTYVLLIEISAGTYNCYARLLQEHQQQGNYDQLQGLLIELEYCLNLIDNPPRVKNLGKYTPASRPSPAVAALLRVATKVNQTGSTFYRAATQVGAELGIEPAILGRVANTLYLQQVASFAQATTLLSYARRTQELVDEILGPAPEAIEGPHSI